MIKNKLASAGFTLLETMIAMAIMMVAFSAILMVQSASINTSAKSKQMNVVGMLAKRTMIETEYEIEGKTFDEVRKEMGEAYKEPFQDYRWTRSVKEIKFPNLNLAAAAGGGDQDKSGGNTGANSAVELMTKLLTNFLSKAIREVTVTVFWKRGSGEQSFSVSTYWVDLNHEFALSE